MSLPDGEFPSNGRCARAFVGPPLYYASDNPTMSRAEDFEDCQLTCEIENFQGKCDWFAFHPYSTQNCRRHKGNVYGYDRYSTAAEHVWNMAGGDPKYMTRDTYLGQPIFGGDTRCPLEEDVGNGCTNFAVADCYVVDTKPDFTSQAGLTDLVTYDECLSECAKDDDNTYMLFLQRYVSKPSTTSAYPPSPPPLPLKTCWCFTEFSQDCSMVVSRFLESSKRGSTKYAECQDPSGSDLPGDYPLRPPSAPAPPSSPPIGACGEGTYLDESSGTCKIACSGDRRLEEKAQQEGARGAETAAAIVDGFLSRRSSIAAKLNKEDVHALKQELGQDFGLPALA